MLLYNKSCSLRASTTHDFLFMTLQHYMATISTYLCSAMDIASVYPHVPSSKTIGTFCFNKINIDKELKLMSSSKLNPFLSFLNRMLNVKIHLKHFCYVIPCSFSFYIFNTRFLNNLICKKQ